MAAWDSCATSTGRAKDKDYQTRLESFTTPRLVDAAKVAERRGKTAPAKGRATAGAKAAKAAAPKKAEKKPAAKGAGAKAGKSSSKTAG